MPQDQSDGDSKRDWRVSAILATVWVIAMIVLVRGESKIPVSMIVIATVFFALLIPAMNDIVRTFERTMKKPNNSKHTAGD